MYFFFFFFSLDVKAYAPVGQSVRVRTLDHPVTAAWKGLRNWIRDPRTDFLGVGGQEEGQGVTREEYFEHGPNICRKRFGPTNVYL